MLKVVFALGLVFVVVGGGVVRGQVSTDKLVVHEWGTFTSLQDLDGQSLYGINIDDEPVPPFVHNLSRELLNSPVLHSQSWIYRQKGAPRFHPQVSMRLETPVIYFYPAKDASLPMNVDVSVKFRGGWLTEFYPDAQTNMALNLSGAFDFTDLSPKTMGGLSWRNVQIGSKNPGPDTDWPVWLTPRKVASTPISCGEENEQYLFYRGVGQLQSPLRVSTINDGAKLELRGNFDELLDGAETIKIGNLWLMEARTDGTCAYRKVDSIQADRHDNRLLATADRRFADNAFQSNNRVLLEKEMHAALMAQGLFEDEATAMLNTWQRAYFTSPGLRLFFTVPREWADYYLPLHITGSPKIQRVMIGRVELISDLQQKSLAQLAEMKEFKTDWIEKIPADSPQMQRLLAGRSDLSDLGVALPKDFSLYMSLGRFRNALVADAAAHGKTNLHQFIEAYGLQAYDLASAQ